ncbi:MAG: toxin-antitoxin system HicB family antitoxin [Candidatus Macondimonas sp.]
MSFTLRLPPDLLDRATAQADSLDVSLNRFIALVLEEHFRRLGDAAPVLKLAAGAPQSAPKPSAMPNKPSAPPKSYPAKGKKPKRR